MMKILGLDISSSSTGWSVIDDGKLADYGKINFTGKLSNANKLYLLGVELKRVIDRQKPDEIAIEDVIQVKSVSVAKILARYNGVAIVEAYRHLQRDPFIIEPTAWKKVLEGCTGGSKKCEIQIAVCRKFGLLTPEKSSYYQNKIDVIKSNTKEKNEGSSSNIKDLKKQLKKLIKKDENSDQVKNLKLQIEELSKNADNSRKSNKKDMTKEFDQISMDIYTETGINEDIADSIGVALSFQSSKRDE